MNGKGDNDERELERINRELARQTAAMNQRPDPEMGGLSPEQVHRLIHSPWGETGGAIQFNETIPLSDLTGSPYFREMRELLLAAVRHDGIKATAKQNLPRSFVTERMEAPGDEETKALIRKHNKVINEHDYFLVHVARVVCQVAGLLRLQKGRFVVPQKYRDLLGEERAGSLYGTLLRAFFTRFNLSYLVHYGKETPSIQRCAAYTILRLGTVAREWRTIEEIYSEVFLPALRGEIEQTQVDWTYGTPASETAYRLLHPLINWGLLEGREEKEGPIKSLESVRTSPLHNAFFRFNV